MKNNQNMVVIYFSFSSFSSLSSEEEDESEFVKPSTWLWIASSADNTSISLLLAPRFSIMDKESHHTMSLFSWSGKRDDCCNSNSNNNNNNDNNGMDWKDEGMHEGKLGDIISVEEWSSSHQVSKHHTAQGDNIGQEEMVLPDW